MSTFHPGNALVTEVDPDVIAAPRQVNATLAQMPHPDPRTPDGLKMLRALTANNEAGTTLTPIDRYAEIPSGTVRLHTLVPNGPIRGVMLDIHGGGWAAGAPGEEETFNDRLARALNFVILPPAYTVPPTLPLWDHL